MGTAPPLILHVLHHLVIGGMENGLINLINSMPAEDFQHAVICIEDYSDFRERILNPEVQVFALNRSKIGLMQLRWRLFRKCQELRPAILHSRNLSGLDALLPARLAGVAHIVHGEHGWDMDNLDGRRWKPALLRRLHSPMVSRYVTVSKDLERYLFQRAGIAPARIAQIYNGVDTDRFQPRSKPAELPGMPAGFVDAENIVVGTVGRLQPVKDQASLLYAVAVVRQRRSPGAQHLRVAIVGDGPLQGSLRSLAQSLGLTDLCWMPGALSDVPAALSAMDLFALPSLMEGTSNTLLEAMASGLPVLATAVGGNPELLDPGVVGALFKPRDVHGLSGLIEQFLNDPGMRRRQGGAARELAVRKFGLSAMTSAYAGLYAGLLAGHPSGSTCRP